MLSRRAILAALPVAGVALSGCDRLAELGMREAHPGNLAVFDAVWELVRDEYFDPPPVAEWNAIRGERRSAAAAAPDWASLYFDVLWPMLGRLDQSHVMLGPPQGFVLPAGRYFPMPAPRRGERLIPQFLNDAAIAGLGADIVWDGAAYRGVALGCNVRGPGADLADRTVTMRGFSGLPGGQSTGTYRLTAIVDGARRVLSWSPTTPASPVETRTLPGGVTLVRFNTFETAQIDWLDARMAEAAGQPIVLDLRANGGGDARQLHRAAGLFLPSGTLVGTVINRGRRSAWRVDADAKPSTSPLVILTGPRTGSSAEVLTAALHHAGRAPVVGRTTAGAVLYSRVFPLPDGGRLMLPIRDFLDPNGRRLEGAGLVPDYRAASPCDAEDIAARLLTA